MNIIRGALIFGLCFAASSMSARADPPTGKAPGAIVAGSQQVAKVGSPARLDLRLDPKAIRPQAQLELTVAPVVVRDDAAYVVRVLRLENGKPVGEELGSFSFDAPSTNDQPRKFLIAVPKIPPLEGNGVTHLAIELVPADNTKSVHGSEIKIVSARVVSP
jgi:hypothetical protein